MLEKWEEDERAGKIENYENSISHFINPDE